MSAPRRVPAGLGPRLLLSHLVVVVVGVVTLYLAASLAAPRFFDRHVAAMGPEARMGGPTEGMRPGGMGGPMAAEMDRLLGDAYRRAVAEALGVAALAALVAAVLTSAFVSGQLARPIRHLAAASRRIADGRYAERVPASGVVELDQLAANFNAMAATIEDVERRRLELIGDVAHELRTPIATLEGYLEGLLDGVVEPSDETWARLHTEAGRLRRLVDDLRDLSRAEARQIPLAPRAVAPKAIVEAAVGRLAPDFADKGLELTVDVPPGLPEVRADPDRAIQVLTNLLTNALRYTPAPGRVGLDVARVEDGVRFRVTDTGLGIAPEDLPRIFERFYRVDKSRTRGLGGAGVGLTIARALAEAMGGRIRAESAGPGRGSSFSFELPLTA